MTVYGSQKTDEAVVSVARDVPGRGGGFVLCGLDGEMSSVSLASGGRLIQAGLAVWAPDGIEVFCELIGWDDLEWDTRAAAVHGISRAKVAAAARAPDVDARAHDWLVERGAGSERTVIACGLNVGSFDMPFFRDALPRTSALVSRRSLDINSVCFVLDGLGDSGSGWDVWKQQAKDVANTRLAELGVAGREHDAGYDAAQALVMVHWLRRQISALGR